MAKKNIFELLAVTISRLVKTQTGIYFCGLLGITLLAAFAIASLPIYLYRFLLVKFIAPYFFHGRIGKPVTSIGNVFTSDLFTGCPPRCAIITNLVVQGRVTSEEARETLENRWIKPTTLNGERVYPELRQFIEQWMGFMFWKEEDNFKLEEHLYFHEIKDKDSDKFLRELNEHLLNKRFPLKKSPWEVHIVRNYYNSELVKESEEKEMTLIILRFHHGLADGFSLLFAVIEGLFGISLETISLPTTTGEKSSRKIDLTEKVRSFFTFVVQLLHDFGVFASYPFRERTPWHVSDEKKKWKQLYGRSGLVPIAKIRRIKNRLGGSFTGVLLSSIAAGVSKSLHLKTKGKRIDSLPALVPVPLAGHPRQLINHTTAVIFELPVGTTLDPIRRLQITETNLQSAKHSTFAFTGVAYSKIVGSHFAPISKVLLCNRFIPMGLSNFPGPGKEIFWQGRKGLATDFVAGAVTGVAGVGFMVLSYGDFIRITVSAENAIMEREDVDDLVEFVCDEIDALDNAMLS